MTLETDSRETEHSIYELSGCCLSWGPCQCRLLGPGPYCMTWFIKMVINIIVYYYKCNSILQSSTSVTSDGSSVLRERCHLSVWQVREICHHANINSSGTTSGGLHLGCFTQVYVQPSFRPYPVLSGKNY